jgi:hypothetical protein
MVVLLWGPWGDPPLQTVYQALQQFGIPTVFFDQQTIPDIELSWQVRSASITGWLKDRNGRLDLEHIIGVYYRPYDTRQIPAVAQAGPESRLWQHALDLEEALTAWADLTPAQVLNRPSAMESNHSKPYQAEQIRQVGFKVPDTLITTTPEAAFAFWQHHGEVIYKSISGVRSQVSRLTPAHEDRLRTTLSGCPTQFQQWVPGQDYRVHVVGDAVFACAICSNADDYRYASTTADAPTVHPVVLPDAIRLRCIALSQALNLPLVGIDLRCTPDGEWYCFEANPSPGFTYYQTETGQPISLAVAQWLAATLLPPGTIASTQPVVRPMAIPIS